MRFRVFDILLDFVFVDLASAFTMTAFRGEHACLSARLEAKHERVSGAPAIRAGMAVEFPPSPSDAPGLFVDPFGLSLEPS